MQQNLIFIKNIHVITIILTFMLPSPDSTNNVSFFSLGQNSNCSGMKFH